MSIRMIIGDVRDVIDTLEPNSVDLLLTSPPFWGLRAYLDPDHPERGFEIGGEPSPADYLDTQLGIVEQATPKLTRHASICWELGDSRAGSGGAGGDYDEEGLRAGQNRFDGSAAKARKLGTQARHRAHDIREAQKREARARGKRGGSWTNRALDEALGYRPPSTHWKGQRAGHPPDKSLCGIPTLFSWSLAYGRNLLRSPMSANELLAWIDALRTQGYSAEEALAAAGGWTVEHGDVHEFEPWRVRNLVVWARTNPPVGGLGDKIRDSCSYLTWACKARDRWFDLDAVRHYNPRADEFSRDRASMNRGSGGYHTGENTENAVQNPLGAPPLDHWVIPPSQSRISHFAVMAPAVCVIPIEASCPRRVCRTCGEPSRRISYAKPSPITGKRGVDERRRGDQLGVGATGERHGDMSREAATVGWTSCECPDTGDVWRFGWREALAEVHTVERAARARGVARAERERILTEEVPPLYEKLRTFYAGTLDGFHDGDGWRPGMVLDPFGGSGTTAEVAADHGRDCTLIDLNEDNVALVRQRAGLWLDSVEST